MNICRNALLIYIKKGIFRDRKKKNQNTYINLEICVANTSGENAMYSYGNLQ